MLTVVAITSDLGLSAWVGGTRGFQVGAFVAQSLFLAFVLTKARLARPRRRSPGVFARTMTTGFPTAAREPWGGRASRSSQCCMPGCDAMLGANAHSADRIFSMNEQTLDAAC
jgi:hypothetical protein